MLENSARVRVVLWVNGRGRRGGGVISGGHVTRLVLCAVWMGTGSGAEWWVWG